MGMNDEFEALLLRYRDWIERYIISRMPTTADADDVIQETYLHAFSYFDKLRDRNLFGAWMLSIAKNEVSRWYKHRRAYYIVSFDETETAEHMNEFDFDDTIRRIFSQLPKPAAEVLRYTVDGYNQSEISELCHIPIGTVKSRLYYARRRFRKLCPPEIRQLYEGKESTVKKKDRTSTNTAYESDAMNVEEILLQGLRIISNLTDGDGTSEINTEKIKGVLSRMKAARLKCVEADGIDKVTHAAEALSSTIADASGALIDMTVSYDIRQSDIVDFMNSITEKIRPDADVIWGVNFSPDMRDALRADVIAG